jgi:large subunit ribosomal protein L24
MNRNRFHVKKGDQVEVIAGNFRGSSGRILQVIPRKQQVLIEGVRIIKKHLRKSQDNPSGKIAEREGPIHVSNVKLLERGEKPSREKKKKEKETAKS